jgi:hypothetical protein
MTLNYDWYVFVASLAAYLIFVIHFRTRRDALLYVVVAFAPRVLWKFWLDWISRDQASYALRWKFFDSVTGGWAEYLRHPGEAPLLPFTVTHIGAHIGLHEVLATIWWPLLLCCVIALWKSRPNLSRAKLLLLLIAFFLAEQLLTAAFDPENSPRRALPVLFAFACAWCWVIDRYHGRRAWTIAFIALFALTAFLAFADVLTKSPVAVTMYVGEAIRGEPKVTMRYQPLKIAFSNDPAPEQAIVRGSFPRAKAGALNLQFAVAQAFAGCLMLAFFWIQARARLLPRFAPIAFGAVWLLSAVRFLW